ncbi:alpha/beta fold hydrolase [Nocardioides panacisoli]|uniref:alpha/beta fold hydrolase n=1 Tax=Nocardioides panacisoli TaxID=627624 RepID=UPI001C626D67|nr:alpha/beta fold hydrolase [Nocardioides panacisoli]QYJ02777.1 alpha/beta fold hydrolase [Nocardioides panacisoli]
MATNTRIETVTRDGLEFPVIDDGPLDGEPIVLLHGFPERATSWRYVAPLLHADGYRTLAMDQRGYAPHARPGRRRDHRVPDLVDDVVALVDRVGGSAHVVGHDWGAVVAWSLAAEHPDRVRSLTAVSVPHPQAFLRSWLTSRQGLKSWYMLAFQLPRVPEWMGRTGRMTPMLRQMGMTDEDVARFEAEILDDGALRGGLMWYRGLPLTDLRRSAGRIRVPTTLVWSDDDGAIARAPVDRTPRWVTAPYELVVLEGVTHWIPTQAPEALADAVLARVQGDG